MDTFAPLEVGIAATVGFLVGYALRWIVGRRKDKHKRSEWLSEPTEESLDTLRRALSDKMDFFEKGEIETDIREIDKILSGGELQNPDIPTAEKNADFTWLMINLRDLLAKTEKFAGRVAFTDDVIPMWQGKKSEVSDVTGLVTCFRDAMCHPNSFKHLIGSKMKMNLGSQTFGNFTAIKTEDFESPKCDYEDDFMYLCGPQRIYFKRHIGAAFAEAKAKLLPILAALGKFDVRTGTWDITNLEVASTDDGDPSK